jgi:hypothetical protein
MAINLNTSKMKYILAIIILSSMVACSSKNTAIDVNIGKDYFPLQVGKYIEYKYDSTIYDDFVGKVYTNKYFVKDMVDSSFTDLTGNTVFEIMRYIRPITDSTYEPLFVYTAGIVGNQMQVNELNLRFIKMVYPATFSGVWNGNTFINTSNTDNSWLFGWRYKYADFGKPHTPDSAKTFTNTLTINQIEFSDGDTSATNNVYGSYTSAKEIYAKNVGMVYKKFLRWKKDPAVGGGKRKGYAIEMKAVAHN